MQGHEVDSYSYFRLSKMGFNAENTLFGESSCPDEINHDNPNEDVSLLMAARWGEHFSLGGLAGIPFTGKTGWSAFSAHVPLDGNIVLMFAPHVGIDKDGNVG